MATAPKQLEPEPPEGWEELQRITQEIGDDRKKALADGLPLADAIRLIDEKLVAKRP